MVLCLHILAVETNIFLYVINEANQTIHTNVALCMPVAVACATSKIVLSFQAFLPRSVSTYAAAMAALDVFTRG